jgi:Family of unknown function (DUF5681)
MAIDDDAKQPTSKACTYQVGFAKPPSATRFRKGQSGNPAGRPRGSKNISTILEQELEQRVVIRENGKQKSVTKRRASMKQFVNKAIAGDPRALQLLINYLRELELNPPNRLSPAYDDAKFEMMAARLDDNEQMTFLKLMNKARGGPEMTG